MKSQIRKKAQRTEQEWKTNLNSINFSLTLERASCVCGKNFNFKIVLFIFLFLSAKWKIAVKQSELDGGGHQSQGTHTNCLALKSICGFATGLSAPVGSAVICDRNFDLFFLHPLSLNSRQSFNTMTMPTISKMLALICHHTTFIQSLHALPNFHYSWMKGGGNLFTSQSWRF